MDKFVKPRSAFAPTASKKAKVSIADMMRANGKKQPLGENGSGGVLGSLGSAQLARMDRLKKVEEAKSTLTEEQQSVVDCARDGVSVFFTGNAARFPASVSSRVESSFICFVRCALFPPRCRDQYEERE